MILLRLLCFALVWIGTTNLLLAQLVTYDYPGDRETDTHTIHSDKYKVWVKIGSQEEQEIEVTMVTPNQRSIENLPNNLTTAIEDRTFSYAHVSYHNLPGKLTFRVQKLFEGDMDQVTLHPKSYELEAIPNAENSDVTFEVASTRKHISVNFHGATNRTPIHNWWIKHGLLISVDPIELSAPEPNGAGVVKYRNDVPLAQLQDADVIYFEPGHYNLFNYAFKSNTLDENGFISFNGGMNLLSNQTVYIAGGAYVEGYIRKNGFNDTNQKVIGRGILSARQYTWHNAPSFNELGANSQFKIIDNGSIREYRPSNIIELGLNATVDGIMAFNAPHHGIISRNNSLYENVKLVGWHANNDGYRPEANTLVKNCFSRACDDHFYARGIDVEDCVIWPAYNGSIMTTGWAWRRIGGATMTNIDVIHTEWRGNDNETRTNEGLFMSQNDYNFAPIAPPGRPDAICRFKDIRFEDQIPRFVSLHLGGNPKYNQSGDPIEGYLGDAIFEDIVVENQLYRNLMIGSDQAVGPNGSYTFEIKNIQFVNLAINGECVDANNQAQFFRQEFTNDISFEGDCNGIITSTQSYDLSPIKIFPNPVWDQMTIEGLTQPKVVSIYNLQGQLVQQQQCQNVLEVSDLEVGIYILKIKGFTPTRFIKH